MTKPDITELDAFAEVATLRSFRKAAEVLGLSPSTVSHLMRRLEERMGVRLLHRTTRSVAPTQAGERLLARLHPVLAELRSALGEIDRFRDQPTGRVRVNAPEQGVRLLLHDVVPAFRKKFPDIELDLVTEGRLVDIVKEGFDAGVRLGGTIPRDMIAVQLGGEARCIVVASPRYLARHKRPQTPEDLKFHECIRIRLPNGKLFAWEFEKRGRTLAMEVPGTLILNQEALVIDAALAGLGVAYVFESSVRDALKARRLVSVLDDWCPSFPGAFLYYPGNRNVPSALRAFVDVVKISRASEVEVIKRKISRHSSSAND
ncbi:LysR family transcriptional regulator [Paraburkholderia silvatlantica]|uniref:DNA-binding transcriptional LysR family regulator n=1 Tax=Paraburkholderia silvatlantica TaxID=321895 RepID=A0ABR6FX51_9BURK|nr:LysR family transcriptional regulator [Paraburkholderia silvatlantica]MBB2931958.1 DNA-binding transcriptional LysR family regulator [Paraburkholderia silvatlantica]PVY24636.1 DNA-binding transcriptional LysR family regulator [Paraburkholderia silvatlantica]PXW31132.1 DNA-binding transcriptional LysR family regulator [Paraburkholderia silvatlantica]